MEEVLHANIFFFVTGIAVIIVSALLVVALFHAIKVLKSIRRVVARIEEETESLKGDIQELRAYFAGDGLLRKIGAKLWGKPEREKNATDSSETAPRRRAELKIKDQR